MTPTLRGLVALSLTVVVGHAQNEITPPASLHADGLPPIPRTVVQEVQRYTEARSAGFVDWHPKKVEMLITTRFGNTNQIHAVAAPMGARKQLTFFEEPVGSATYDRVNGDFYVFSRDQGGSEFSQMYRYDFKDGAVTLLTDGGRSQNGGRVWSNRGDRYAYYSTRRTGADRDIYVVDPRDPKSEKRVLELKGGGWRVADWSPDDRHLLLHEYVSINESHLWLFDLASGQKTELTPQSEKGVAYGGASFTADGKAVLLNTDKDFEYLRLAVLDLASKQFTFLTSDIKHDVDDFTVSHDRSKVLFVANTFGRGAPYLLDLGSRTYKPVAGVPTAVVGTGLWHKDNRHVALGVNYAKSASDIYVLDTQTSKITRWTESELGGIAADTLNEADLIRWKSFDGLEVTGFYLKPAARFTGKRPVIISIHGGPEAQANPLFQGRSNYFLNELGVALIYPNVRGSSGFGKSYLLLDNGRKREDSVKDIGALLDWVAQQPGLDASRVLIMGGSYGGYMTLACAVHYNDRIRAAIDIVGISNFVTFLENTESYRRDLRRVEYGDERDPEMRKFLQEISPITHAKRITKPLFVIQGANDPRVPKSESVQMVETIRRNGGTVWYLEGKDEGHGFRKKANADFQFYAMVMFMRQHLL